MQRRLLAPLVLLGLLVASGCEREHPATTTVRAFLDAVQYADRESAFAAHVDSTRSSAWCAPEFERALTRAQQATDADECRRVRGLSVEELDALPDDVRLVIQITGWACENREAGCADYARTVFEQAWDANAIVQARPVGYTVRKVFGEGAQAVAYVDVALPGAKVEHRTLQLVRHADTWLVSDGFLRSSE